MRDDSNSSGLWEVLKIRPFLYLWLAQLISQIGFNMLTFVLGVIVYSRLHSNTSVSLLYLTVGIPAAVFGLFSGVVVDRFSKKRLLISTTLSRFGLILLLLFLFKSPPVLYFFAALISMLTQFFVPAEASLMARFVPPRLLLSANALFTVTFYSAILGGFVVGGPLLEWGGEELVFLYLAFLFLVATLFLLLLPPDTEKNSSQPWSRGIRDIAEMFTFVRGNSSVLRALLLVTLAQAVMAIFATLGPGFADRILRVKLTDASLLILAPAALGMIGGTFLVGNYGSRFKKRDLIKGGILLSGILLTLVGLLIRSNRSLEITAFFHRMFSFDIASGILPLSVICFFFLGFANSLIDISCNAVLQEQTDSHMRGRVYGLLGSLINGVAILPVLISGILADTIGIGKIIFGLGIVLILFWFYTSSKELSPTKN